MTETFTCPACGAPQDPPDGDESTVECPYCGHNVIVPPELRRQPEPPAFAAAPTIVVKLGDNEGMPAAPSRQVNRRFLTCLIVGIAVIVLASILIPLAIIPLTVKPVLDSVEKISSAEALGVMLPPEIPTMVPAANEPVSTEPAFAEPLLSFGQEGLGAGMFKDARSIAIDGEGRIYVAEYIGGRVQAFDSQGSFITQWKVDPEWPLVSMAAGRDGTVYIVQGGQALRFRGPNGAPLDPFPSEESFDDVFITLDGGLLASSQGTSDDIFRFDPQGQETLRIPAAISGQSGNSELDMNVAEDGLGNIYALGSFNEAVFVYDSRGKFLNRIGSRGDEPGQFRAVEDIVVDGQGRIYVSDIYGVQVFEPDGRFFGRIEIDESPFGLVVDDQDNLYVAARTKVYKFHLADIK